jgi:DNA-binding response OmpR family regulator
MRILVVEDSVDLADAIADVLFDAGHDVAVRTETAAHLIDDLLELLVAERFDAVLLDLGLGSQDGAALANALALSNEAPAVLLCTGAEEERIAPLRDKVAGVLTKPFSPDALLTLVSRIRPRSPSSGIVPAGKILGASTTGATDPLRGPSKRRDTA